jgi:hypothetical protein
MVDKTKEDRTAKNTSKSPIKYKPIQLNKHSSKN